MHISPCNCSVSSLPLPQLRGKKLLRKDKQTESFLTWTLWTLTPTHEAVTGSRASCSQKKLIKVKEHHLSIQSVPNTKQENNPQHERIDFEEKGDIGRQKGLTRDKIPLEFEVSILRQAACSTNNGSIHGLAIELSCDCRIKMGAFEKGKIFVQKTAHCYTVKKRSKEWTIFVKAFLILRLRDEKKNEQLFIALQKHVGPGKCPLNLSNSIRSMYSSCATASQNPAPHGISLNEQKGPLCSIGDQSPWFLSLTEEEREEADVLSVELRWEKTAENKEAVGVAAFLECTLVEKSGRHSFRGNVLAVQLESPEPMKSRTKEAIPGFHDGCNYKGGLTADHKAETRENWQRDLYEFGFYSNELREKTDASMKIACGMWIFYLEEGQSLKYENARSSLRSPQMYL
ncbi:hypothetical protein U0070_012596, partial [Myodes glareolus]